MISVYHEAAKKEPDKRLRWRIEGLELETTCLLGPEHSAQIIDTMSRLLVVAFNGYLVSNDTNLWVTFSEKNAAIIAKGVSSIPPSEFARLAQTIVDQEANVDEKAMRGDGFDATSALLQAMTAFPSKQTSDACAPIAKKFYCDLGTKEGSLLVKYADFQAVASGMEAKALIELYTGDLENSKDEVSAFIAEVSLKEFARASSKLDAASRDEQIAKLLTRYLVTRTDKSSVNDSVIELAKSSMTQDTFLKVFVNGLANVKDEKARRLVGDIFLQATKNTSDPRFANLRLKTLTRRFWSDRDMTFLAETVLPELTKQQAYTIALDACGVLGQDGNLNEKEIKDFDKHHPTTGGMAATPTNGDEARAGLIPIFLADVRLTRTAEQTMKVALGSLGLAKREKPECRLTSQELVELLKMPTVFGEPRVVIPDHLGNCYPSKFTNHWQFVRYAQEHNLDFTKSLRH